MAENTREGAKQRAEGRERRRSMLTEPFEKLSDATGGDDDSSSSVDVRGTVKRAVLSAAVAAAVGAAAGAAKTMLDRRGEEQSDEPEARQPSGEDEQDDGQEARAEPAEKDDDEQEGRAEPAEEEDEEPEARAEPEEEDEDDKQEGRAESAEEDDEDEQEGHAEPPEEDEDEPEGRAERADDDESEPEASAEDEDDEEDDQQQGRAEHDDSESDDEEVDTRARVEDAKNADTGAADIVPQAREQLEHLLGRAAESVSGFEREDGHWRVNLEVVELRRIPDSSDVLASYELVLDDEGHVARMTRTRRYQRAEVESGS